MLIPEYNMVITRIYVENNTLICAAPEIAPRGPFGRPAMCAWLQDGGRWRRIASGGCLGWRRRFFCIQSLSPEMPLLTRKRAQKGTFLVFLDPHEECYGSCVNNTIFKKLMC